MLENAFKFRCGGDIQVRLEVVKGEVCFHVANQVAKDDVERAQRVFGELLSADPARLYLDRIEENAARDASGESGLGFLTIMNDYGASLGWSFDQGQDPAVLTTLIRFPLSRSAS